MSAYALDSERERAIATGCDEFAPKPNEFERLVEDHSAPDHNPQIDIPTVLIRIGAPPGRRTVNTEPLPGSLATVTSPPIMRASLRDRARPRPVFVGHERETGRLLPAMMLYVNLSSAARMRGSRH